MQRLKSLIISINASPEIRRKGLAYYIAREYKLPYIGEHLFSIVVHGHTVIVDLRRGTVSCSCMWFTTHKEICSHIVCAIHYLLNEVELVKALPFLNFLQEIGFIKLERGGLYWLRRCQERRRVK